MQLHERLAGRGLDRVDRDDAVFTRRDERLGVGKGEGRDLANVQVLKKTSGLEVG